TGPEEYVVPGFGVSPIQVHEGDSSSGIERLPEANGSIAVQLPAGLSMFGEKEIAAGTQLQVASHLHLYLSADAPGMVFEVATDAQADLDRTVDQRLTAPPALRPALPGQKD